MSYQAVIRDETNHLVTTQVGMQISIVQGTVDGMVVYSETQTPTPNINGLVTIEIGADDPVAFAAIDWSDGPYFIKTETDPDGGTDYTITGVSQLLSVPYALCAENVANEMQDLSDVLSEGNDAGSNIISNVADPTDAQDAATKAYVDALITQIQVLQSQPGIVKDFDRNLYTTIKIGDQVWMGENLKTTYYNDGEEIPFVTGTTTWSNLTTHGYCWYNNDAATYKATYGALYNWYTVNTGKLCPTGWHVPSDAEWTTLTDYLGGTSVAGGKLKEGGAAHWTSPNTGATNEYGFTALPGGLRNGSGTFVYIGSYGFWWSATETPATNAWNRAVSYTSSNVDVNIHAQKTGLSVRCLKD